MNERILSRTDFADYCSICGFALTQYEIAAEINGGVVLYDDHKTGTIEITLCSECKNHLMELSLGGMEAAIIKRLGVDNSLSHKAPRTKSSKKRAVKFNEDRKDDEDDGSGGVKPVLPPE